MFRPPKPACLELNLAPMVDVMMCLIVFFLLASKLVEREHYRVNLPWAAAAQEVPSSELGTRVTINVRQTAAGDDADFIVVDWDGQAIIERVLAPGEIEHLLRLRKKRADDQRQEVRCVIRADQDVQYRHVETVLRAAGLAKIANVVFSANKGLPPTAGGAGG